MLLRSSHGAHRQLPDHHNTIRYAEDDATFMVQLALDFTVKDPECEAYRIERRSFATPKMS